MSNTDYNVNKELYRDLRARLTATIKHAGLSQAEVARRLGIHESTLHSWRLGTARPLPKYHAALNDFIRATLEAPPTPPKAKKTPEEIRARKTAYMQRVRREATGVAIDALPYASISGENAPLAKLTLKKVRQYRKRWANGAGDSITKLAEEAGVAKSTMHNALHGVTFKE